MKKWKFFALIFICFLLEITFLHAFEIHGVHPDLVLIALIISSLTLDLRWALALGIFSGFLQDILSIGPVNLNTPLYLLVSFLVFKLSRKVSLDSFLLRLALVVAIVMGAAIITRFVQYSQGQIIPPGIFLRILLLESLLAAIAVPFIIKIIGIWIAQKS